LLYGTEYAAVNNIHRAHRVGDYFVIGLFGAFCDCS
jgi:hypothetical protein